MRPFKGLIGIVLFGGAGLPAALTALEKGATDSHLPTVRRSTQFKLRETWDKRTAGHYLGSTFIFREQEASFINGLRG